MQPNLLYSIPAALVSRNDLESRSLLMSARLVLARNAIQWFASWADTRSAPTMCDAWH